MQPQRKYALQGFILLCIFILELGAINRTPADNAAFTTDTARVKLLFHKGNQFFDGPSDSLIFYYTRALHLIDRQLESMPPATSLSVSTSEKSTWQKLKYEASVQLGIEYLFQKSFDTSETFFFDALALAKALGDTSLVSESYAELGTLNNNKGNYRQALVYQQKALEIANASGDREWIAICKNNIGNAYKNLSYHALALTHYLDALSWFEQEGQLRRIAVCYQNIGDVYVAQKNLFKAHSYYEQALQIAQKTDDRQREADSYLHLGKTLLAMGRTKEARKMIAASIETRNHAGYRNGLDDCYLVLGETWIAEHSYEPALEALQQGWAIASETEDKENLIALDCKTGLVLLHQNKVKEAYPHLYRAWQMAQDQGSIDLILESNLLLSAYFEAIKRPQKALEHFKAYSMAKDTLFDAEKYRVLDEMETMYNLNKKELDISMLNEQTKLQNLLIHKRNRLLIASLLVMLSMLIAGHFYIANSRLKAKKKSLDLEIRLLRAQMHPHFIFNALVAIQGYIYDKNPLKAGDLLAKFADLIRKTLESSKMEYITLSNEIETLKLYLELQAVRFSNKFTYAVTTEPGIDEMNTRIPPMMVQPFIENAIEHGLRNKPGTGSLDVHFRCENNTMEVTITDNGIGRKASALLDMKGQHLSMAVPLIRERLEIFGKNKNKKYSLEMQDIYQDDGRPAGTLVKMRMPCLS